MNRKTITYFILILSALALGGSIKILNAIDAFVMDEISMPAPVSLNVNGKNFCVNDEELTMSQYCTEDAGFTFFFATRFDKAFTLRMVIDSEEPFRLNHRYEIPLEGTGMSLAGLQDYCFGKGDDRATSGWIEFTGFEKEGGILTRDGDIMCAIEGRFAFSAGSADDPEMTVEVTEGTFRIPGAKYRDLRK